MRLCHSDNCEIMKENNETPSSWKYDKSYTFAILSWTTGLINIFYNPKLLLQVGLFNYLLVHIFIMVVIGIPMTLMELAISQYSLKSVVRCWDLCPFFRGIGYGKVILIVIFQIYYNVLNSYILFYCFSTIPEYTNLSNNNSAIMHRTNSEKFWYTEVVQSDDKLNTIVLDMLNWKLIASLCATMALVFIFNIKETNFLQKLLPLSFNFSILEFILIFFVTNTTPGGLQGIKYLLFKNTNLNSFLIWKNEGIMLQVFQNHLYSMGLALGGFSSIAAQNTFRKPVYAMSIWTNLANLGTILGYGLLFSNLYGIIQFNSISRMDDIVNYNNLKYDFDYIFTIIPEALLYLPGVPQVWKIIFYSSIYLKGLCTSSLMISTVINIIYEENPHISCHAQFFSFLLCIINFIIGSLFFTRFGPVAGQFISNITHKLLLPLILTCEVIAVILVYGLLRFMKDLHFMLGTYPTVYWTLCLTLSMIIIPILSCISVVNYFKYTTMTEFEIILLKAILSLVLVWIPFMGLVRIIRKVKFQLILKSARNWGPANRLKRSRKMFEDQQYIQEFLYEKYLLETKLKKYE